ncbi:MAG: GNAT family N-acetyltransferase [Cellulomonadaceae bacterium]
MTDWTIHRMPLPEGVDAPDAWGLHALQRLTREIESERWGHDDFVDSAEARLAGLRGQDYVEQQVLLAVPAGLTPSEQNVAAAIRLHLPRTDNAHRLDTELTAPPSAAGTGASDALLRAAEDLARERGRTTLTSFSETAGEPADDDPAALAAPTGSGRVDGADPVAVALAQAGFRLEQAERYSRLDLPVDPELLARLEQEACARAGDYRLVQWRDRTPEHLLDQYAHLHRRMSTDAPAAGVEIEEQGWDADRVRHLDRRLAERGYGYVLTAAEHVPSGTLVAYTYVAFPRERREPAYQEDTLVLREHRGHRLGMLMKVANLQTLTQLRPGARRVHTWNAEENSAMLDINVALGFRAAGVVGIWQRRL